MSFRSLLDHSFTVERLMAGARGARNRATTTWKPIATVAGARQATASLAQKERPQLEEAGTAIPSLTVFLDPSWTTVAGIVETTAVTEKDRLVDDDGSVLWIDLVNNVRGHHLELQVHEVR